MILRAIILLLIFASPSWAAIAPRGYAARSCGFDGNRNGVVGEAADCNFCDGVTTDPDGDGTNEDLIYVDCGSGTDSSTCGAPGSPCRTINYALNTRADGPGDGAEDIICFKGTCSSEPSDMDDGPNGVSTGAGNCGGNAYYVRSKSGNEVRDFRYPCNPTMIVGWDSDNDGQYPPFDTDDVAVVNGAGKRTFINSAIVSTSAVFYKEFAHFTILNYGDGADGSAYSGAGALGFGGGANYAYWHDIDMSRINRNTPVANPNIWFSTTSPQAYMAYENLRCSECGGFGWRGGTSEGGAQTGPIRLKNISTTAGSWTTVVKPWGNLTGFEVLDSIFDHSTFDGGSGLHVAQCVQDVDIVNNEIIDFHYALSIQPDGGSSFCQARHIDNVRFDRNRVRRQRPYVGPGVPYGVRIEQVGTSAPTATYVDDVTITNNIFDFRMSGSYLGAIWAQSNRTGSTPIPGTVTIVGNTVYGNFILGESGTSPASIAISPTTAAAQKLQNYVIRNNLFVGIPTSAVVIRTVYAPTNLQADYNVYDPQGTFVWNGGAATNLATWRTNLGGCPGTDNDCNSTGQGTSSPRAACEPTFVNVGTGDFHLRSDDTCARDVGTSVATITAIDYDKDPRPQGVGWDIGADEFLVSGGGLIVHARGTGAALAGGIGGPRIHGPATGGAAAGGAAGPLLHARGAGGAVSAGDTAAQVLLPVLEGADLDGGLE